jgi:protein-tyrosine phosphatase
MADEQQGRTFPGLDATEVYPNLFIGAGPRPGMVPKDAVDVLVLAAAEYQPKDDEFPGVEVLRAKLYDEKDKPLDLAAINAAVKTGQKVAKALADGKTVLVTCRSGLNRSAFVAAIALMVLTPTPADHVVEFLREKRGEDVLSSSDQWAEVLNRFVSR